MTGHGGYRLMGRMPTNDEQHDAFRNQASIEWQPTRQTWKIVGQNGLTLITNRDGDVVTAWGPRD